MSEAEKKPEPAEPTDHDGGSAPKPPLRAAAPSEAGSPASPAPHAPEPAEHEDAPPEPDADAQAVLDEIDMRDLLRNALAPPPGAVAPDLLRGVQRKLRRRSRGKFYGDGWSTARSPRSTYLFTSILMLALIVFVFVVLVPWGSGALP
jgi:hypothetical protein